MLELLVRGPMAVVYAIGIVIMMICALPGIVLGVMVGFLKWSFKIGLRLSSRLFLHFTH